MKEFITRKVDRNDRDDLNASLGKTDLFVNETNIVDEQAVITNKTHVLESSLDGYRFTNSTWNISKTYDTTTGYLTNVRATNDAASEIWLVGTRTLDHSIIHKYWPENAPVLWPTCNPLGLWKRAGTHPGQANNWGALYYGEAYAELIQEPTSQKDDVEFRSDWHLDAETISIGVNEWGYQGAVEWDWEGDGNPDDTATTYELIADSQHGGVCGGEHTTESGRDENLVSPGDDIVWDDLGTGFGWKTSESECTTTVNRFESNEVGVKAEFSAQAGVSVSANKKWGKSVSVGCGGATTTVDSEITFSSAVDGFVLT